jgi:hypothetical protein
MVLLMQSLVNVETGSGILYTSFLHATIEASIIKIKKECLIFKLRIVNVLR